MKSTKNNNFNNNSSWLGFSLCPHLSMEVLEDPHHRQSHQPTFVAASGAPGGFFLPPFISTSNFIYGVNKHEGYHSQLPTMPLKSNSSLCLMEALSKSQKQAMVLSPVPKLLDSIGSGTNMGEHQYSNKDIASTMDLSLDNSMCCDHKPEEQSNGGGLELLHEHLPYYQHGICSLLTSHELYQPHMNVAQAAREHDGARRLKNGILDDDVMNSTDTITAMEYSHLQSLSLSMSPVSRASSLTGPQYVASPAASGFVLLDASKERGAGKSGQKHPVHRKLIGTFGQRTSQYRGVTRHRWTGRYEAHLWDSSFKKEGQTRKGKQVYLGGYDMEEKAARAYDLAALKYWGTSTHINFPLEDYQEELEDMKNMSRQEFVAQLRRKSSGFSRGASIYRGVTKHHQHGRWQARIGRVSGNKDLYLGTFSTQEEAAEAYDIAAIKFRGLNAVTNFDVARYDVDKILAGSSLLAGELARRNKYTMSQADVALAQCCSSRELNHTAGNSTSSIDLKIALYRSSDKTLAESEEEYHKHLPEFQNDPFANNMNNTGCSTEGGVDRADISMLLTKIPHKFANFTLLNSWNPSNQLRPAPPLAYCLDRHLSLTAVFNTSNSTQVNTNQTIAMVRSRDW